MKRITVSQEYATDDFAKGSLIYDQCAGVAFVVTSAQPSEHSVMVYGKRVETFKTMGTGVVNSLDPVLTDYSTMFMYGDSDIWALDD